MDPLTQGALGALASIAVLGNRTPLSTRHVALVGAIGGMAADLDVLISSDSDPLLAIKYHRHFTHSLVFVPVGGLLSSLPWLLHRGFRADYLWVLIAATLGYATHGLLDACTTYGTLLFWPFSQTRVGLRFISVVDFAFTLPLLACLVIAAKRRVARYARFGLLWAAVYMTFGVVQQSRARALQARVAHERGHALVRSQVFPTFTNNVAWRSLYQANNRYYVDKLRVTWTGRACVTPGTSVLVLEESRKIGEAGAGPRESTARAQRLLRWFAGDWVALDPEDPSVIGDLRYSFSPTEVAPIWGLRTDPEAGRVEWVNNRSKRALEPSDLVTLVSNDGPGHRCY